MLVPLTDLADPPFHCAAASRRWVVVLLHVTDPIVLSPASHE